MSNVDDNDLNIELENDNESNLDFERIENHAIENQLDRMFLQENFNYEIDTDDEIELSQIIGMK